MSQTFKVYHQCRCMRAVTVLCTLATVDSFRCDCGLCWEVRGTAVEMVEPELHEVTL